MAKNSFQWRGETYRLESSTWHFWGNASLIELPGNGEEFRMTPDDARFCEFAVKAGFERPTELDQPEQLLAAQAYLENNDYRVWRVREALHIIREDSDREVSARLLTCLIDWFFLIKVYNPPSPSNSRTNINKSARPPRSPPLQKHED